MGMDTHTIGTGITRKDFKEGKEEKQYKLNQKSRKKWKKNAVQSAVKFGGSEDEKVQKKKYLWNESNEAEGVKKVGNQYEDIVNEKKVETDFEVLLKKLMEGFPVSDSWDSNTFRSIARECYNYSVFRAGKTYPHSTTSSYVGVNVRALYHEN